MMRCRTTSPQLEMDLTLSDDHKSGSTVPSLPAELVLHIIRLSLPSRPGERSAWNARVAVLCACALVNSTWRALAERELYRSIEVWNETAGKLLCRTMGKRGGRGKQLAGLCTDMAVASHWSGCHSFADSNRLGELLGLGTQLVELKLCSIWDVDGWAVLKCPSEPPSVPLPLPRRNLTADPLCRPSLRVARRMYDHGLHRNLTS